MNIRKTAGSFVVLVCGTGLLASAVVLLQGHVQTIKNIREDALPLAASLPPLERRAELLKKQVELAQVQATIRGDTAEEKLRTYVLPKEPENTRLLAFIESIRTFLERRDMLQKMSAVTVGDPMDTNFVPSAGIKPENVWTQSVHFAVIVTPEGREQLLSLLDLSGLLTVGDALTQKDMESLFALTEEQNYAGIVPIEQFLSADLQSYVQDPNLYNARLTQAMPSETFLQSFRSLIANSRLDEVRRTLEGDLGRTITARKLWPVQYMSIDEESLETLPGGWEKVELTLKAYGRKY